MDLTSNSVFDHQKEIDGLRAEIERLRSALTKMADCGEHPCAFCFEMAQVAKRALDSAAEQRSSDER